MLTIGILIFDQVEVLDFAGPYEVFTTAARVHAKANPNAEPIFKVFTIAQENTIQARAGLTVLSDCCLSQHPELQILIVPGGVVTAELDKAEVIHWIRHNAVNCEITASVCTGAFLLAKAGLLDNQSVTTHWEDIADLRNDFPQLDVIEQKRWVDNGAIITSAGISAGIDMSLHIVARLAGQALAINTARQMEFDWQASP